MAGTLNNRQVAAILYEVADLLEIKDVKFKPVAYRRAAHGIETLAEDINRVAERDGLEDLPGVGTHIATKLREILSTGKLQYLERLKQDVGPGVREIAEVGRDRAKESAGAPPEARDRQPRATRGGGPGREDTRSFRVWGEERG